MSMRKITLFGGLAAGAAFALAPLASAEDPDPLGSLATSEIGSMNFLFETDAALAGVPGDVVKHPGTFDTIPPADAPQTAPASPLDYLLYGLNPIAAGPASDPGAYNVMNGSMVQFDDGINSLLYALSNNDHVLAWDSGDLFGGNSAMDIATGASSGWEEAGQYFQAGMADLLGYFGIFGS
ncbi:hypothetical protein [Mycolicibacter sinensis]|uniref:Uncharacterized protein n=1 Tax=Mycolicibacter sinensis (strain JDM601) TaxID=875328 RepID=A0A1A2EVI9_MYCSD|nr:hypothetical protein [Mycolicibacter sinensis]OBG02847.1 hypothetical protein A5772_00350 [Mycolicibacter sinensis]OBG09503.1 hypothetical protein A5771_01350 [Mycolicibacter sinensis]